MYSYYVSSIQYVKKLTTSRIQIRCTNSNVVIANCQLVSFFEYFTAGDDKQMFVATVL